MAAAHAKADSLFVRAPAPAALRADVDVGPLPVVQPAAASVTPAADPVINDLDGGWDE